jgi:L-seryl-tRNA(Ser) seleniumtransferase
MQNQATNKTTVLRALPAVDQLIKSLSASEIAVVGDARTTRFARQVIEIMRRELITNGTEQSGSREQLLAKAQGLWREIAAEDGSSGLQRVVNATGVILHTNLGRAALSQAAREAILNASGYCTLEFDLSTGSRGRRAGRVEELLKILTGAEGALVVNNCASAALLVLTALAHDGETVVSRGELVEIGGDFRVPDVLANSGTKMVEVGTTNRTRLDDYRRALTDATRLLMRIHPSNYRIIGFTAAPALNELVSLAKDAGLTLYEDAGSGVLSDLNEFGLTGEPIISESIAAGVDVVSFSGDKLLGGPQAGLLVGKSEVISRLRKHSLYRALRADKLCLAALEATLDAHARGTALSELPTLRMLAIGVDELRTRSEALVQQLQQSVDTSALRIELLKGESAVGGGSGPNTHPPTVLIALSHQQLSAVELESKLRRFSPPIIGRIAENRVLLDLRTVDPAEEHIVLGALTHLATNP